MDQRRSGRSRRARHFLCNARPQRNLRLLVEPLEQRLLLASDFGDAPAPYPTTTAENGAEHGTSGALQLGQTVDSEADGTHSPAADADGSDEDGVTFSTLPVGALDATATVEVGGSTGTLDAWIDFNQDGSWAGADEHIFTNRFLTIGTHPLTFAVPATALTGQTYARFRISTVGHHGTGGAAMDGEVEDYQVTIAAPAAATGNFGSVNTISMTGSFGNAPAAVAADIDGDGDMDVVASRPFDGRIIWQENDGNQGFTERVVSTMEADGARNVLVTDMDADGDLDVVGVSRDGTDSRLAWYENSGTPAAGEWAVRNIAVQSSFFSVVHAADVDADGDMDVLAVTGFDDRVTWYENRSGGFVFFQHDISLVADNPQGLFAADVDSDGDMDVISANADSDEIVWYELLSNLTFKAHTIFTVDEF